MNIVIVIIGTMNIVTVVIRTMNVGAVHSGELIIRTTEFGDCTRGQ